MSAPTNVVAVMTPEEALMLPADKLPETLALPRTSSFAVGLFVPIPSCACEVEGMILTKVPSELTSRKFANWDKSLLNAMVLVAGGGRKNCLYYVSTIFVTSTRYRMIIYKIGNIAYLSSSYQLSNVILFQEFGDVQI